MDLVALLLHSLKPMPKVSLAPTVHLSKPGHVHRQEPAPAPINRLSRVLAIWYWAFAVSLGLGLSPSAQAAQEAAVIHGAMRIVAAAPAQWEAFREASEAHERAVAALRGAAPNEWAAIEEAAERAWIGDVGCEPPRDVSVASCVGSMLARVIRPLQTTAPDEWAAVEAASSRERDARLRLKAAAPEAWAVFDAGVVGVLSARAPMHVATETANAAAKALDAAAPMESARYAAALADGRTLLGDLVDADGWSEKKWEHVQSTMVAARAMRGQLEAVAPAELAIWEAAFAAQGEAQDIRTRLWRLLLPR